MAEQNGRAQQSVGPGAGQLKAFNENQLRIAQLSRDVELCQANYRKYSVNLEQARIDQALEAERMSNLSVVQPASYEPRAVRPQRAMSMAMGMVLGLLGGVGLAVAVDSRDRRLRSPEDLETKLSIARVGGDSPACEASNWFCTPR